MSEERPAGDWNLAPFECAPGLRLQAHEHLMRVQIDGLRQRQNRLEMMIERLERRLWVTVYGVVGVILAQAFQSVAGQLP
ncbi:hypothetical protein [Pseudooceanicola sp.]|uniref:GTA head formation protein, RCAP_rcc01685 family n=1 Tax=Pseudooceanicola sp. TaxID=1914328 RepID=UPI00261E986B|nr:hypothetical protein [Pseudooceanicola sp.]MDF1854900.1 hypothetical protein [Pseudooceanicola sp.]